MARLLKLSNHPLCYSPWGNGGDSLLEGQYGINCIPEIGQ